jgi:hypothetical protein
MAERYIDEILHELIDALEDKLGTIEGFECRLDHNIKDGKREGFATVKEFSISYLHTTSIDIKDLK